ncbi:MAG: O-antigen ligase family protein [Desulfamplus sp.]|nr:O-antigen ligase family protein [Desulfamplus sp.]
MEKNINKLFKLDSLTFVRVLIILEIILISFFTAPAEIIEVFIFLSALISPQLRNRVLSQITQPLVIMSLLLYGVITIGLFYTIADMSQSVGIWGSWRKLLLIPIAISVYDDSIWKKRFIFSFLYFITFASLLSFLSNFFAFTIYKYAPGIVLHNHATQGMLFSVSIYICLVMLRYPKYSNLSKLSSILLKLSTAILFYNVVYITPGRSGYAALYILITLFILFNIVNKWRYVIISITTLALAGIFILSPVAKNRIQMGIDEIKTYENAPYITSMGIRMVMWKQTIELLQHLEYPFWGYGTGSFQNAYQKQIEGRDGLQGEPSTDPHNQYLRIAVEHGFIGLLIFFAFIASFFLQKGSKEPTRILAIGVLIAWCATSLFSTHFSTFTEGRFIMIWCGVLLAIDDDNYKTQAIKNKIE